MIQIYVFTSSDSPQKNLEILIKSGYPWNLLGMELKHIDEQFETITTEYSRIDDSIKQLSSEVTRIKQVLESEQGKSQENIKQIVREVFRDNILTGISVAGGLIGLVLMIVTNDTAMRVLDEQGYILGFLLILLSIASFFLSRK